MLENLSKYHIILGSKSPRRRELLSELRIPFDVVTIGGVEETYPDTINPIDTAQYIAEEKAAAYRRLIKANELIITADTTVVCGNHVLGKPHDTDEAVTMLKRLSGKIHHVASGVCISTKQRQISFSSVTEVKFAELTDEEISFYVNKYNPIDKAGAYGIQEWIGAVAVEWINGSYYNVMGLPVHRLYNELKNF